jgi:ribonuclease-3
LGAVYLTAGYDAAAGFLDTWLAEEYTTSIAVGGLDNYKAVLQELTQSQFKLLPEYRLVAEIGPEHDRYYDVEVWVAGVRRGMGRGRSKKAAEQQAAQAALTALRSSEA